MNKNKFKKQSLDYHKLKPSGKIEIKPTKRSQTEFDLSLAYSPGVAYPCMEIHKKAENAYFYTNKGNLVAVISDGSAVLGLGDIGPLSSKPVMEGKAVLFKKFAGIDVFDIELKSKNKEDFVKTVKSLEPSFGGINLEDIKAPDCFYIEEQLKKSLNIPVFHDDQHGTAIISGAALINAAYLQKKKVQDLKTVINGAGAAAISCARYFQKLGLSKKNIIMCDSKGVIFQGRKKGMNEFKKEFARKTSLRSLKQALKGCDFFCGLSVGGIMDKDMLLSMNSKAIIFALANPDPEISPDLVKKLRPDIIVATGRSDYPNQVNNVLGFPAIFRGALDTQSSQINDSMKLAATYALSKLARKTVPDSVSLAYKDKVFKFGPDYIIPKPFDPRVLTELTPEICKAAMKTKVARKKIKNFKTYQKSLESHLGFARSFIRESIYQIQSDKDFIPRIIFPEGENLKILKSLHLLKDENILKPILIGSEKKILKVMKENGLNLKDRLEILEMSHFKKQNIYKESLTSLRAHKKLSNEKINQMLLDPYYLASLHLHLNKSDASFSGAGKNYLDCVKPILEIIRTEKGKTAFGMNMIFQKNKVFFFADTTLNINPSASMLAHFALQTAQFCSSLKIDPNLALLSFTNFSQNSESAKKIREALKIIRSKNPKLTCEGELQADIAVNSDIRDHIFPKNKLQKKQVNILIFPNLEASNIAYKLVQQLGESEMIGPFLLGTQKTAGICQITGQTEEITDSIIMTALDAQKKLKGKK